jgi:phosphatidylethanolamine-binding protein (PEBP) family uncharacterized protein
MSKAVAKVKRKTTVSMGEEIVFPGTDHNSRCMSYTQSGLRCKKRGTCISLSKSGLYCRQHRHKPIGPREAMPFSRLNIEYPKFYVAEQTVSAQDAEKAPFVNIPWDDNTLTLVMIDPDAPVAKAKGTQMLHWLVTNLDSDNDDLESNTVVPYKGPAPPPGSGPHRYIFYLLEQAAGPIDVVYGKPGDPGNLLSGSGPIAASYVDADRSSFDLQKFVDAHNLEVRDCTYFVVDA